MTESEIENDLNHNTNKNIDFDLIALNKISEHFPGWIHLNRLDDLSLMWMSKKMENDLNSSTEQAIAEGTVFLDRIIHPETNKRIFPKILALRDSKNYNKTIGFIQMIRYDEHQAYLPHYTTIKISKKYRCFISQTTQIVDHKNMMFNYLDLFGGNEDSNIDYQRFETLTKREKEILKLIAEGYTNLEISIFLKISVLTVKTHRQNINKKLDTNKIHDLIRIALTYCSN